MIGNFTSFLFSLKRISIQVPLKFFSKAFYIQNTFGFYPLTFPFTVDYSIFSILFPVIIGLWLFLVFVVLDYKAGEKTLQCRAF